MYLVLLCYTQWLFEKECNRDLRAVAVAGGRVAVMGGSAWEARASSVVEEWAETERDMRGEAKRLRSNNKD